MMRGTGMGSEGAFAVAAVAVIVVVVTRDTEKEYAVSVVANRAIKEAVMRESLGRCNIIIAVFV